MILGAQLFTLRDYLKTEEDIRTNLKKVADMGYKTVQVSSVGPIDAQILKDICDSYGLEIIVTHTKPDRLLNETEQVIKEHDIYNCKYIGLGSMPVAYRSEEGYKQFVKDFTPVIEKIYESGKKFMYHHHSFEFFRMSDGKTLFEHMLEDFPKEKFGVILDTYWLQNAGVDICEMIEKLDGRLECVHLKDMCLPKIENTHTFAPIGEGNIDFKKVIDCFKNHGVKYMFVEQDTCEGSPFDCLKRSYDYVNTLDYGQKRKLKLGIIGIGNMGSSHCKNIVTKKLVPNVELVAVADISEERRKWAKDNLPYNVKIYNSGDEMLDNDKDIEAVIVAVPHYFHPYFSIKAMKQGLHVMCEKPAGVYTKQVREMNEVAEKSNVVFGMMFNQRTNCVYRKLKEMLTSGELGEIRRVNWIITDWFRSQYYYDSGAWRATWSGEGGGVLLNQCPHNLDLLQWLCGMPVKVRAFCHIGKWHDIEVEDDVTAYMEFPNGATGVFITTTGDLPGTNRLEITCEKGTVIADTKTIQFRKLSVPTTEYLKTSQESFKKCAYETIEVKTDGLNESHSGVLKAFAGKIIDGTPLVASGTEGINGLTLSNAMHLSSWLDKTVELPFDEDLFYSELQKRIATSKVKKEVKSVVSDTSGSYGN